MVKAILWDWDGTLVDSHETIRAAYNAARKAFNMPAMSSEEIKSHVSLSGREALPKMFGEHTPQATKIFYQTYQKLAPETVVAKPNRTEILSMIADTGYSQAVLSNKKGDILRQECQALGWQKYFTDCIGAGDTAKDKPAPHMYHLWAENNQSIKQAIYIGDAPIDAHFAQHCHVDCILLCDETHKREVLQNTASETGAKVMSFNDFKVFVASLG